MLSLDIAAALPEASQGGLLKCPTGIRGLDEITFGGLPQGRPTLVCGSAGCGKTLLGMEFLVRGATAFGEPGVCLSFEETAEELRDNVAALGFDVPALIAGRQLAIDHIFLERSPTEETGDYDLEALFVRLGCAIDSVGARRVLLDGLETLFSGLNDLWVLRSELHRLFRWLKERHVTVVVTGERGACALTRHGLEEYISDCVILLDYQVTETILTRRMRIVKYRGSMHGANEYPFLIEQGGISVLPVSSSELKHVACNDRIPTGIAELDRMLGGSGYYRASSVLLSGTAGTGKTSLSAHLVDAACARGEKCIFFSFEESANQIVRNMRSIGIDLGRWVEKGLLHFQASRPTTSGLEMHLVKIHNLISDIRPSVVVVDPITGFLHSGTPAETRSMVLRLVDFLKEQQITAFMTTLTGNTDREQIEINISSLVDTWLLLRDIESAGERNRGLYILKARGVAHSNQIREFLMTSNGVQLREVYLGESGLLTGSARVAQEAKDESRVLLAQQDVEKHRLRIQRRRKALDARMAALRFELQTDEEEEQQLVAQEATRLTRREEDLKEMARSRFLVTSALDSAGSLGQACGGGR